MYTISVFSIICMNVFILLCENYPNPPCPPYDYVIPYFFSIGHSSAFKLFFLKKKSTNKRSIGSLSLRSCLIFIIFHFIYFPANHMTLCPFMTKLYSIVYIQHDLFVHSSEDKHLGWLHSLAIVTVCSHTLLSFLIEQGEWILCSVQRVSSSGCSSVWFPPKEHVIICPGSIFFSVLTLHFSPLESMKESVSFLHRAPGLERKGKDTF